VTYKYQMKRGRNPICEQQIEVIDIMSANEILIISE